jgi:NAD(P)-dependent dehydrogenase (short-subunit alcohol dehydrogenase family)/CMP-N-acetylneuraminic acid synthetase
VPGKNSRLLNGKPLIAWAIEAAKKSKYITEIFVSTDSEEIAKLAQEYGATIPFIRPCELAQDATPERLAWRHAIEWEQHQQGRPMMEVMVSIPPTTPLRAVEDVDKSIELFLAGGADTVIGVTESDRHPSFNMVTIDTDGYVALPMPLRQGVHRRQDAPPIYNISTAVYVSSPRYVMEEMVYMNGRVKACILPKRCSVDIDNEEDFLLAEFMMKNMYRNGNDHCASQPGDPNKCQSNKNNEIPEPPWGCASGFFKKASLEGRVAVITGGAGYLGKTMASALAEMKCKIVIVDIDSSRCDSVAAEIKNAFGVSVLSLPVDLSNERDVRNIPIKVFEAFGRMDILVNNAAYVGTSGLNGWAVPFEQQSSDSWRKAVEVNLTAVFNLTQASCDMLKRSGHGSIVNIASIYGIVGPNLDLYEGTSMGNPAAYAVSKGGLLQFSRWCSTVLAPEIRVNAITPGGIFRNQDQHFIEKYVGRTPLKRMAREEDFQGAIVYLASDLSRYVTGQNLVIDGGYSVW